MLHRVGTDQPLYDEQRRGFLPFVTDKEHAFRVLPARYSAYVSVQLNGEGNQEIFGPARPDDLDKDRQFWVPIHKLFNGTECIRDLNLNIIFSSHHINEKIKRIHLELKNPV